MSRTIDRVRRLASSGRLKWLGIPGAALLIVGTVLSQSSPPPTPLVSLSSEPLYARGARSKPTLTLALSVEFPTVGAQYVSAPGASTDNTYSSATQYIGYFDSEGCYTYHFNTSAATKRFDRTSASTNHLCAGSDEFSGNFMNWASSSAVDILRYGLTGGDRVVDQANLTVLQRAVLPNSNVSTNFWNGSNFPDKQIAAANASGVLPVSIVSGAAGSGGTIHIANCLNRIHFGTAATGSCGSPGNNSNLGAAGSGGRGPAQAYPGPASGAVGSFGGTQCAVEDLNSLGYAGYNVAGGNTTTCAFTGLKTVLYGIGSGAAPNGNGGTGWIIQAVSGGTPCSYALFGYDPAPGTYKKCYVRAYQAGDPPAPTVLGGAPLTDDGFFYTRVSVCNVDASQNLLDPRPDLCLRYPSGYYKPVGNLQKYSDRLRVSAFGYLNDATGNPNERYGGVLRAPMKYVGPTYYDQNFNLVSGNNPNQEWDATTGVFFTNPDGNGTIAAGADSTSANGYLSGVIPYLNQFGRTGTFGQYKTFDPVGELYYESLRYLQGLPATPQATSGLTTAMQDGFPVTAPWTDPHPAVSGLTDYSCVKNSIVGIGDVNTHNDKSFPGNGSPNVPRTNNEGGFSSGRPANPGGNEPDFYAWTRVVGGFESNTAVSYADGGGVARTTANFNPPNSARWGMENQDIGADGAAYFLAGAAYWGNTHDIRSDRPGMRVSTYFLDVNEYGNQNNATTRHNNQFFLAAKYGGFTDLSRQGTPFKKADLSDSNAPWEDPANPGEAKNYFLASSASAVLSGLNQIFASVAAQANSIAGGAVSTQQLTSTAGQIYQAQFDPAAWSGDLKAYAGSANSGGNVSIANTPTWQASTELATRASSTSVGGASRNIVIGKTVPTSAATATAFTWGAVDANVQAALRQPPYAASGAPADPVTTGQARLDYLRGDRTNESPGGLLMRRRAGLIGDIVNSAVTHMGAPSGDISDASYAAFAATHASRKHALFVGANDGMLHAFDPDHGSGTGSGGDEIFAYIPSWMIPKLAALTSTSYVHQSYVDGSAAVAEAKVGSAGLGSAIWKTVLVGATGAGGQGVYALDVTDPASFNEHNVMWEFTDADDADLGNVIGRPQILKLRSTAASATADYQYFAVVASGVNSYANDGHFSTTGNPAIFLLDLSKPAGTAWSLGTNYYKISFPSSTSIASGLAGFTARLGSVGEVAQIFAGDLQGNLWKLDFSQALAGKTDWNLAKLSYFKDSPSGTSPVPMVIAKSAGGVRQPITMDPTLIFGPSRSLYVAFGTGKYLETSDNTQSGAPQQSVYAVLDNNTSTADTTGTVASAISGRGRLAQATANSTTGTITVPTFTWGRSLLDTDPSGIRSGWYFDFTNAGERQISDFAVLQGLLVFGSVIPSLNSCDNGSGNLYITTLATGAGSYTPSNVGILGQPYVVQVNNATLFAADSTGLRSATASYQVILQGSGGLAAATATTLTSYFGRLSWRELSNYQQIRHNP